MRRQMHCARVWRLLYDGQRFCLRRQLGRLPNEMVIFVRPEENVGSKFMMTVVANCGAEILSEVLLSNGPEDYIEVTRQYIGHAFVDGEMLACLDHFDALA